MDTQIMEAKDYTCRCDKHNLKPYEYCEMCWMRTRVQNVCEDARKMISRTASQVLLKMSVIEYIIAKQEQEIRELQGKILQLLPDLN